jgi:hypothetical protein
MGLRLDRYSASDDSWQRLLESARLNGHGDTDLERYWIEITTWEASRMSEPV